MKLVDILFLLTAAATTNAILIPTGNNDSTHTSGTSSQLSGTTDEPNPQIPDDDWQEIMDIIHSNTSNQDQHQPMDQPSPSTSNQNQQQPMNQPITNTPNEYWKLIMNEIGSRTREDWQEIIDAVISKVYNQDQQHLMDATDLNIFNKYQHQPIDVAGLDIPDKYWQRLIDEVNSDTFEDWQELFDIAGLNTPSQVSDPIDQVSPNTFDKYQQQPADQPNSSIPDQTQQHLMDATDLNISNKDQQQPIDQSSPSTSKRSRKRRIDQSSPSTSKRSRKRRIDQSSSGISSQAPGSTNEPNQNTSGKYWKPLVVIINTNIPSQDPVDESGPSTSGKYLGPLFVIINPSTSSQDQQQPMEQDESVNTVSNQVTGLNEKDQRTFDCMKKKLEASKELRNKKWQEYRRYINLEFEQQMTLAMGKEISGSRYDPEVQKQLKQEYEKSCRRVYSIRRDLKDFMKRRGLEFDEPDPD